MRKKKKKEYKIKREHSNDVTFPKDNKIENEGLNSYSSFSYVFLGSTSYERMNCHERITDWFFFLNSLFFN